jgi:hypothetical protein
VVVGGEVKSVKIRLKNTGGDRLYWGIDNGQSPYWSYVDSGSGELGPGNETDLTFTIDSWNIFASTYTWNMWLFTNDPAHPQIAIPFSVTITSNHAPFVSQLLSDVHMGTGLPQKSINLAEYFGDPDQEALWFYAESNISSIASAVVSGSMLTITAHQIGNANMVVVAQDRQGEIAVQYFNIIVGSLITGTVNPIEISKLQNHPNPFEGGTQVTFSLQKAGTVDLKLLDVTGKERELISAKRMDTGDHSIEIGEDLNPGIYLCRLMIDGSPAGVIRIMKK